MVVSAEPEFTIPSMRDCKSSTHFTDLTRTKAVPYSKLKDVPM